MIAALLLSHSCGGAENVSLEEKSLPTNLLIKFHSIKINFLCQETPLLTHVISDGSSTVGMLSLNLPKLLQRESGI